jgi:hypothetical protein
MEALKAANIWEEAVKEKNKDQVINASERILLVLGGPSVGKANITQENHLF